MEQQFDYFMERLRNMSPSNKKRPVVNRRTIDKVFTNFKGNYGRYLVLPINSVIGDTPFVGLANTKEICIPRKNMSADGKESVYNAWIRLLPREAFDIKDPSSGRIVSSLTASDEDLMRQANTVWEELYKEVDGKNNAMDPTISSFIRRKNYSVFHAYCVNQWTNGEMRTPSRTNFSALFVMTSKSFMDEVMESIQNMDFQQNGDISWRDQVYNRKTTGREGYLMFTINKADGPGFKMSFTHNINAAQTLGSITIPDDDMELMGNPVETFLGWQAAKSDAPVEYRKVFNPDMYREAIGYMTDQLAAIRMAKQNKMTVKDAIDSTNSIILSKQQPTNSRGQATNDPVLAQFAQVSENNVGVAENPQAVMEKNTNPFQTPPAGHFDPLTGAPAFGGEKSGDDLPF